MNSDVSQEKKVANPYYTYGIVYLSDRYHKWELSKGPRYRAYREAWASRPANLDFGDFPLSMNIEVTTRCNLACTFCTQPTLTKEQLGDLPWDVYAGVIEEGEKYGLPAINLNGLGEPLLLRNLPEMIKYAKQHGVIDAFFHTNATIMTETIAKKLIDSGLDRIVCSVDSPDKNTYESMRIHGRFDRVIANVKRFVETRNKLGKIEPLVRTTMVVTNETVDQIPQFIELWKPFADQITLQDLTWREKKLPNGKWANQEMSAMQVDLDSVREEAVRRGVYFVCPYLYQSSYTFWNADIIPCSNPNARKQMVMGNLKEQNFHEIWHGDKYKEIRELHAQGRWHEHPVCRDCEVPLIELLKALEQQGVQFDEHGKVDNSFTGTSQPFSIVSKAASGQKTDESVKDIVLDFQNKSGTELADKDKE